MSNILGFTALGVALIALSNKSIIRLRWWHLSSSILYIVYGFIIEAPPVLIGATLYCLIHTWYIYKHHKSKKA